MDKLREEKLRKEFEKQIREELLFDDEELQWQPERNCYAIYGVHLAWCGYRASRESLVVELPRSHSVSDGMLEGEMVMVSDVIESLSSIGISIKGEE